jgi:phosphate uptake regulator
MQRKLVQLGTHSYMSAIPKKWLRKHNLKKGDSIDFTEVDNKLVISSTAEVFEKKTEMFIDPPHKILVWRLIQPLYSSGYEEVKLNFKNPLMFKEIERCVNLLADFEIIETNPNYVIIKSISTKLDEDIQPILKRTWQIIKQMALIVEHCFVNKDKQRLQEVYALEQSVNKYVMLMKRIINRTGYKYPHYTYMLVYFLDLTANHYEYIRRHYVYYKNAKVKTGYAEGVKQLNQLLFDVYDLQYNFTLDKFNKIASDLPHFKWFEDLKDDTIKYHYRTIAGYLVQISRNILPMNISPT